MGTDDGLVQRTQDGGAHWKDVTPRGTPLWTKIAAIDLSSLKEGVAYIAIDGHRIDDVAPHILRTSDGGQSWQEIDSGLPRDHFASVVRADPAKAGLLFAGTDAGAYVSLDDGARWSPLGRNLPTAWVTDLLVHGNDLIAATEGRAIWAMDDIAPLREGLAPNVEAQLFTPAVAIRTRTNNNTDTPLPPEEPQGQNPREGTAIDYWLGKAPSGPVTLEIRDGAGGLVRRFASNDKPLGPDAERYFAKGWTKPPQTLSAAPGFHRFQWNLRYERPPAIEYNYSIAAVWGEATPIKPEGLMVLPGDYSIVLTVNGHAYSAPLRVEQDPRIRTPLADLKASLDLSQKIAAISRRAREGYGETAAVKKQLNVLFPKAEDGGAPSPKQADPMRALAEQLRAKPAEGEVTFESVDAILASVESDLEDADAAPTVAEREAVDDAATKLGEVEKRWASEKAGPLAALNAALKAKGKKVMTIPPASQLDIEAPETGEDLP